MTRNPKAVIAIGPLRPGGVGKHWVQPPLNLSQPTKVCNASSTGTYTGTPWNLRPGAEDHKRWPSVGVGC